MLRGTVLWMLSTASAFALPPAIIDMHLHAHASADYGAR
jgi:hypothetical protein